MDNLSGLTIGNTTFPVGAGGGGVQIVEGEYDIAQVRCGSRDGTLNYDYATILSQDKTHVWYQRQGLFTRFVIRFESTSSPNQSYGIPIFSASDLIGDGKIVPAGQTPTFAEAICAINEGTLPQVVANIGFITPSCGFVKSKNAATAGDYIFVFGTASSGPVSAGQVAVISGTVVW